MQKVANLKRIFHSIYNYDRVSIATFFGNYLCATKKDLTHPWLIKNMLSDTIGDMKILYYPYGRLCQGYSKVMYFKLYLYNEM